MSVLAITGGTGFVGRRLIALAVAAGHSVRALARRPQPDEAGVTWIEGALDAKAGVVTLCRGADAVIHVAGAVNATSPDAFEAANVTGTANMVAAASEAGVRRFVHVSSLAAREPDLSAYGASKARAERLVEASALDWDMVRPPAVYGPGDKEMLELFRMARRGFVLLPPDGRLSLIEVSDLCRLLLALAGEGPRRITFEPHDGRPAGHPTKALAALLAAALGRPVRPVPVPAAVLRIAAFADGMIRREAAKLTPDRVRYFCHPDWVSAPAAAVPPALWQPQVRTPDGFRATASWYKAQGWL